MFVFSPIPIFKWRTGLCVCPRATINFMQKLKGCQFRTELHYLFSYRSSVLPLNFSYNLTVVQGPPPGHLFKYIIGSPCVALMRSLGRYFLWKYRGAGRNWTAVYRFCRPVHYHFATAPNYKIILLNQGWAQCWLLIVFIKVSAAPVLKLLN